MNKLTVLFYITFFAAVHGLTEEEKMAIHEDCFSQSGVSEEMASKVMDGVFVDDPKLKLYILCFAKKVGIMNDSGDIQVDVFRAKLGTKVPDEVKLNEIIAKCAIKKGTPEETIFALSRCTHGNKS
uniref:Odorant-binding protein 5 n=1 Tax=Monochamus alternatus TaxID=192382 RepID=A0A075CN91_MONAT|nr:odorant-binding protein 5 [Monochamus alternatus]